MPRRRFEALRDPPIARRRIEILPDSFRLQVHEAYARRIPVAHFPCRLCFFEFAPELRTEYHRMPGPLPSPRHHDLFIRSSLRECPRQPIDRASTNQRVVHGVNEKCRIPRHEPQPREQGTELPRPPAPVHHHARPPRHRPPDPLSRIAQNNYRPPQPRASVHGDLNRRPPSEFPKRLRKSQPLRPSRRQNNRHNLFLLQSTPPSQPRSRRQSSPPVAPRPVGARLSYHLRQEFSLRQANPRAQPLSS
jgi:hypothetical protein